MPRTPTFPVCFDEVRQVTITSLRRRGLLNPNGPVSGSYGWTRGGKSFFSIDVIGNLPERWVEFDYIYKEKRINYRVHLESLPKKMGGCEWYFTCPATGRRCRKLYGIGGRFLSRFAYPSVMYSAQIESKGYRDFFTAYRNIQREREHFSKRHARTKYKGKTNEALPADSR
ncbi:MAG: hypothetical protein IPJ30_12040 [Acidobacteria bacterium]|nr:hypothetical protein [Acidobacteriota bacterium]